MKTFVTLVTYCITLTLFWGCQDDDVKMGELVAPSNIQVTVEKAGATSELPNGDGSGKVTLRATADNAVAFQFKYKDDVKASSSGVTEFLFGENGVNTYEIAVIAVGAGGLMSNTTITTEVLATFTAPPELIAKLTSGPWRIKNEIGGHFGLGPVGGTTPSEFFSAPANDKMGTGMYDDRYIFEEDGTFIHITNSENDDPTENPEGTVFGRVGLIDELGAHSISPTGDDILNYPLNDNTGNWSVIAPGGILSIALTGTSFIGYYTGGNHRYELFQLEDQSENDLLLRTTDGNNGFDWWFIITNKEEGTPEDFESTFTDLKWEDSFDTDGAPDETKWTYDLGTGNNGWGNNEAQTYTKDSENVSIDDGILTITAIKEGNGYTSARLKTQGLYSFTYGRVEVRAKLPATGGTWPAIWLLGSNITEVGWPACGEMDIMEHVGNKIGDVSSALHHPARHAGNAVVGRSQNDDVTTEFHTYTVDWTEEEIVFLVDDEIHLRFDNEDNLPFYENDFFIILNVAVGGTLGGAIDPGFTESSMEIDYVKVFQ